MVVGNGWLGGHRRGGIAIDYGGNVWAVGGFLVFGGNDIGGSNKPKYGGICSAVMQYGVDCLAVMQYSGNFLEVSGFLFFGGNVNVNSNLDGNCGA